VEIVNPGGLLFPREDLGKRMAHRNPLLMDMVHGLGLVEKAGSGIKRMKKSMEEYGLDIDFEVGSFFSTVFHRNVPGGSDANPTQIRRRQGRVDIGIPKEKQKDRIKGSYITFFYT